MLQNAKSVSTVTAILPSLVLFAAPPLLLLVTVVKPLLPLSYSAYAQSTPTNTVTTIPNPSSNSNAHNACQNSPQQSQGQIPPFCGKLIVTKFVQGGTASPSDFTLAVTGNSVSQSTFQGSSIGTTIVLAPGSYQITEVHGPSGYTQGHTDNRCDMGTISAGQTIVCRIINIFNPPDTQPPQALSFTVQPSTVSLSIGSPPGTITITAHLTDQTGVGPTPAQVQSGSGFTGAGIFIQDECGESPGFFQALPLHLVSGTLRMDSGRLHLHSLQAHSMLAITATRTF